MFWHVPPPRGPVPPPPTPPREPEWFKIAFGAPRSGWIHLTLTLEGVLVTIPNSQVFDPFGHIVRWLEALTRGGEAVCEIDMEGSAAILSAHPDPEPDLLRFTIWFEEEELCPVCDLRLGRRDLVRAFHERCSRHGRSRTPGPSGGGGDGRTKTGRPAAAESGPPSSRTIWTSRGQTRQGGSRR